MPPRDRPVHCFRIGLTHELPLVDVERLGYASKKFLQEVVLICKNLRLSEDRGKHLGVAPPTWFGNSGTARLPGINGRFVASRPLDVQSVTLLLVSVRSDLRWPKTAMVSTCRSSTGRMT